LYNSGKEQIVLHSGRDNGLIAAKGDYQSELFVDKVEAKNLELALRHSADLISRHTKEGIFLYVSPSCSTLLGYTQEELYKDCILSYCHPQDKEILKKEFRGLSPGSSSRISFRFRRKEGDYIWLETSISTLGDGQEAMCISRDMTERVIMEEENMETQEKYRFLVEYSRDTIGMTTEKGIWTYMNDEGKKVFGFTSSKEIIGASLYDYVSPSDHGYLKDFYQANQAVSFELNLNRSDGNTRKAAIQLIPTVFKNRKLFQIIIKDVTGQKKTEEKLHNAEKLSVVGQLAAGIAHEIRNPLTAIKGFTQLLTERKTEKYADVILSELERIEEIVNDLLVLAKPVVTEAQETNLVNIVKSVVTLLNTQALIYNIMIDVKYSLSEISVRCEIDKIKQVLINVIKNSIEAMPHGGKISVEVRQDNSFAMISVKDEGVGIPEERLPKLGEPFYSTKEKGTGLGLMICNRIIKSHGGNIYITSKENEGTIVKLLIPVV
jgi:two-component system, sporulation sensor kinase A